MTRDHVFVYSSRLDDKSLRLAKIIDSPGNPLARLDIELVESTLQLAPPYLALSYTWGPFSSSLAAYTENDIRFVWIDGQPHAIFPNLFDALVQLRETYSDRYFWVDSLCINQNDLGERQAQVQVMDQIYRTAEEVIIWLGPSNDQSEEVVELVHKISRLDSSIIQRFGYQLHPTSLSAHNLPHPHSNIWKRYLELYDLRWFYRSWVIQEVVLAKSATAHWGPWRIPWLELLGGCQIFVADRLRKFLFCDITSSYFDHLPMGRNLYRLGLIYRTCTHGSDEATVISDLSTGLKGLKASEHILLHLLRMARDFDCSDPRDRVYSLLGLVNHVCKERGLATLSILPNYNPSCTAASVLTSVAEAVISGSQCLGIMSHVSDLMYRQTPGLPSWVPDFIRAPNYSMGKDALFDASRFVSDGQRGFQINGNALRVHATCVGNVRRIAPSRIDNQVENLFSMLRVVFNTHLPRGVDRLEVLWRTMIWDVYGHAQVIDEHPAPDYLEDAFFASLVPVVARSYQTPEFCAQASEVVDDLRRVLSKEQKDQPLSLTAKLIEMLSLYSAGCAAEDDDGDFSPNQRRADPAIYSSHSSGVTWSQCLFWLDSGFFAMGPQSVDVGDSAWIISGCPFPMILRPRGSQSTEFEVLGRAYIHGIMHGEGVTRETVWESISLT